MTVLAEETIIEGIDRGENDGFCHIFYDSEQQESLCGYGGRFNPAYCWNPGCYWRRDSKKTCPCQRTVCPDCILIANEILAGRKR